MSKIKKILFVFGTRPEAIKLAPLILKLKKQGACKVQVCVTGQHREMLDQVLDFFEIIPDVDLNLMIPNQSLNTIAGSIFEHLDQVYLSHNPDCVIVHGDTTTSSIAAWAAYHRGIKVAHVEAGLRTYDKYAPFPEEINRQITSRIADIHFAPTIRARENLQQEGIDVTKIFVTGNTVVDALMFSLEKLKEGYVDDEIKFLSALLDPQKKLILVTGHRRENFGSGIIEICEALKLLATSDVQIIYPVHLNPQIKKPVFSLLEHHPGIQLIDPLGYPAFVHLMAKSYLILTDSGGIQEEALSLGKPVLVMRDTTERPEALDAGGIKLVGTTRQQIVSEAKRLLGDRGYYAQMSSAGNPFGDGKACERIMNEMCR